MQIIITSRQMELTPRLRQHIEHKVQRLSRLVDTDTRIEVVVADEHTRSTRDRYSVQLALANGTYPIRSEVRAVNANMALDLALDKITTQLGRKKDRETSTRRHRTPAMKVFSLSRSGELDEQNGADSQANGQGMPSAEDWLSQATTATILEESNEEIWSKVVEIRRVQTKPMDDQEAIVQMEALGLSFYPFYNEATSSVNVIYRLNEGEYGLLMPDLE